MRFHKSLKLGLVCLALTSTAIAGSSKVTCLKLLEPLSPQAEWMVSVKPNLHHSGDDSLASESNRMLWVWLQLQNRYIKEKVSEKGLIAQARAHSGRVTYSIRGHFSDEKEITDILWAWLQVDVIKELGEKKLEQILKNLQEEEDVIWDSAELGAVARLSRLLMGPQSSYEVAKDQPLTEGRALLAQHLRDVQAQVLAFNDLIEVIIAPKHLQKADCDPRLGELVKESKKTIEPAPALQRQMPPVIKLRKLEKNAFWEMSTSTQMMIHLGVAVPSSKGVSEETLAVVASLLSSGLNSKLEEQVRKEVGVSYRIYAQIVDGFLMIHTSTRPEWLSKCLSALETGIKALGAQPMSAADWNNALALHDRSKLLSVETVEDLAYVKIAASGFDALKAKQVFAEIAKYSRPRILLVGPKPPK